MFTTLVDTIRCCHPRTLQLFYGIYYVKKIKRDPDFFCRVFIFRVLFLLVFFIMNGLGEMFHHFTLFVYKKWSKSKSRSAFFFSDVFILVDFLGVPQNRLRVFPPVCIFLVTTVSGKITRPPRLEFCPHFARRLTHLHWRERRLLPSFGWMRMA